MLMELSFLKPYGERRARHVAGDHEAGWSAGAASHKFCKFQKVNYYEFTLTSFGQSHLIELEIQIQGTNVFYF